jgi:hypothetical protein
MKHRVVVTGLGLVTPLGNTVEATFATLPTRNATWIMWRTKRARRLWNTHSRTVSASAVRTRHSFSDALRSKQTRSAEFAAEMGSRRGRRQVIDSCCLPPRRNSLVSGALRLSFGSWGNSWRYRHAAHLGPNAQRSFSSALSHPRRRSVLRSQPLALGVQKLPLPRHIPKPGISCRLLRYRGTAVSFSHRQYVGRRRESPIRFILPSLLRQSLFEA